jgi:HK97 family phage portal protein
MQSEIENKGLRGLGGSQWENMDGMDLEGLLRSFGGSLGMNVNEAMQQAAFLICSDVLAQDCGKANLSLRKKLNESASSIVKPDEHPVAKKFALDPNDRHTWSEFVEMTVYWLAIMSAGYMMIVRRRNGDVSRIIPLQPWNVNPLVNVKSREIFYEVTATSDLDIVQFGFRSKRVPERDMIHVRRRMMDGFKGMPTLHLGASTFRTSANYESYRDELATNAGEMRGVFKKVGPGALSEEQFQRLRRQLGELLRRNIARKDPVILEDGIEFQPTSANAAESELSKQFNAQIIQVCRFFRMPAHKALHLEAVKYENMEVQEKAYVGDTLDPLLKSIEQRMNRHLLTEDDRINGYFIEFDRTDLALRDPKVVMEQNDRAYRSGMITEGEARAVYGHEPGPRADFRQQPANSILIDGSNKPVIDMPKPAPKADNSNPDDDETEPKKHLRLVAREG